MEQRIKKNSVPETVIIYFSEAHGKWVAQEQYVKKSRTGKVIPYTGSVKLIFLDDPEDYEAPEGFKGNIIIEGELE